MSSEFSFYYKGPQSQRGAFRTKFTGVSITVANKSFALIDLSISGLSFYKLSSQILEPFKKIKVSLIIATEMYMTGLEIEILRITGNTKVACRFSNLSLRQEIALDKLIVEMQKRTIIRNKNENQSL